MLTVLCVVPGKLPMYPCPELISRSLGDVFMLSEGGECRVAVPGAGRPDLPPGAVVHVAASGMDGVQHVDALLGGHVTVPAGWCGTLSARLHHDGCVPHGGDAEQSAVIHVDCECVCVRVEGGMCAATC